MDKVEYEVGDLIRFTGTSWNDEMCNKLGVVSDVSDNNKRYRFIFLDCDDLNTNRKNYHWELYKGYEIILLSKRGLINAVKLSDR